MVELLLRLSNEMDIERVEARTMKENLPMRTVFKKLGIEEEEAEFVIPGLGVVCDVQSKNIQREKWLGLEFEIEILKTGPGDLELTS